MYIKKSFIVNTFNLLVWLYQRYQVTDSHIVLNTCSESGWDNEWLTDLNVHVLRNR